MQRVRETSKGLQISEGLDIATFSVREGGVDFAMERSALSTDIMDRSVSVVGDRYNVEKIGEWFIKTGLGNKDTNPEYTYFASLTESPKAQVAVLAAKLRTEEEVEQIRAHLEEILPDGFTTDLGSDGRMVSDIERGARSRGFDIPDGHTVILTARQKYSDLHMYLHPYHYDLIPFGGVAQLGEWVLGGLNTLESGSIWR